MTNTDHPAGEARMTLARRTLVVLALTLLFALIAVVLAQAGQALLVVFAGVLVGIWFTFLSHQLTRLIRMPYGLALALMLLLHVLVLAGCVIYIVPRAMEEFGNLLQQLPGQLEHLRGGIEQSTVGQHLLQAVPSSERLWELVGEQWRRWGGLLASMLGVLSTMVLVTFVGISGAVSPGLYRKGLLALVPPRRRDRAAEVLEMVFTTLARWLMGRLVGMTCVGLLTGIGLALAGMPLAFLLGVIAFLLSFIPNFGPIISYIPGLLLALGRGPEMVLIVSGIYLGAQLIESYLVTPFVQHWAVNLLPVTLLTAQLVLGSFFGVLGLMLATPLAAVAQVLVGALYQHDALGETEPEVGG